MPGMFDDLIPQDTAPSGGDDNMFADLIPKQPSKEGLGIMSLPSDVAELGARGIDWAARKFGAEPREPQPFSFQRADPRNPEYAGIWKKAAEAAVSGATLPGDVYAGKVDPLSDEGIRRATELGMFVSPMSPAAGTGAAIAREAIPRGTFASRNVVPPIAAEARAAQEAAQEFGVPLSRGFASRDPEAMRMEDLASRSTVYGKGAQDAARGHFEEQAAALNQASRGIGETVAREGSVIESPKEAGEIVGAGIRGAAQEARSKTGELYKEAFDLPGQFHAGTFEGIGNRIKGSLTLRDEPVIIDDVTAPIATKALGELDRISGLKFQNLADPRGMPNAENIVAVNLRGVDQARKRLNAYYAAARRGQNNNDVRAIGSIIHEFDDQIENAIANGLFSGDERALGALRAARASYSNYVKTFRPQGSGDDVGLAMRKIIDRNATPEEIANMVVGIGKIGEKGTPVRLAERLETVFGKDSEELSAVRQAIWQKSQIRNTDGNLSIARSAEATERLANSTLGQRMFSPEEREVMGKYANVLRSALISKYARTNSDTTPAILQMLKQHRGTMLSLVGHGKGIPFLGHMIDYLSAKAEESAMTRKVQESLSPFPPRGRIMPTMPTRRPVISPVVPLTVGNQQGFKKGGRVTKTFRYADGGKVQKFQAGGTMFSGDTGAPPAPPPMDTTDPTQQTPMIQGEGMWGSRPATYFDQTGSPPIESARQVASEEGISLGQLAGGFLPHNAGGPGGGGIGYNIASDKGGFFTVEDLYGQSGTPTLTPAMGPSRPGGPGANMQVTRQGAVPVPSIATFNQQMPSTNNWRLLGMGPSWIMRNGFLINTQDPAVRSGLPAGASNANPAAAEHGSQPISVVLGTGSPGFPSLWTPAGMSGIYYWPGATQTIRRWGGDTTARGGRIPVTRRH